MGFLEKLINRANLRALKQLQDDENYHFVRQNSLFSDLNADAFLFVMNALVERHYKPEEMIFEEGNPGICMFLIKSGRVEIFSRRSDEDPESENTVYSVLEEGVLFGEVSIISMSYRTSSAKALDQDTTLLTMSAYDLEQLLERYPGDGLKVLRGIVDSVVKHLIETDRRLKKAKERIKNLKARLKKNE